MREVDVCCLFLNAKGAKDAKFQDPWSLFARTTLSLGDLGGLGDHKSEPGRPVSVLSGPSLRPYVFAAGPALSFRVRSSP